MFWFIFVDLTEMKFCGLKPCLILSMMYVEQRAHHLAGTICQIENCRCVLEEVDMKKNPHPPHFILKPKLSGVHSNVPSSEE